MANRIAILMFTFALMSCAPPIPSGNFDAPDPASRTYALVNLVREYRGPEATNTGTPPAEELKPVVAMLLSSDPMERFMAIEALRDLTGQDLGYNPSDPLPVRAMGVERWRAWIQNEGSSSTQEEEA